MRTVCFHASDSHLHKRRNPGEQHHLGVMACYKLQFSQAFAVCGWNVEQRHVQSVILPFLQQEGDVLLKLGNVYQLDASATKHALQHLR